MAEHDVTILLRAISDGDRGAIEHLIPLVYDEIRAIAGRHMSRERRNHTLQPTALTNEAYLRLVGRTEANWENRAHFFGVASQVIRRVLVEHARARGRDKRGGNALRITLDEDLAGGQGLDLDFLALDGALEELGEEHPEEKQVVELRFFGGMSVPETAKVLDVSSRTVERRWTFARAWLFRKLRGREGTSSGEAR